MKRIPDHEWQKENRTFPILGILAIALCLALAGRAWASAPPGENQIPSVLESTAGTSSRSSGDPSSRARPDLSDELPGRCRKEDSKSPEGSPAADESRGAETTRQSKQEIRTADRGSGNQGGSPSRPTRLLEKQNGSPFADRKQTALRTAREQDVFTIYVGEELQGGLKVYSTNTGKTAYCLDLHKYSPSLGWCKDYPYNPKKPDPGINYIACHGWPYTKRICGYDLNATEAMQVTQVAIWTYLGQLEDYVLHMETISDDTLYYQVLLKMKRGRPEVRKAFVQLVKEARAYGANPPQNIQWHSWSHDSSDSSYQPVLVIEKTGTCKLNKVVEDPKHLCDNPLYSMKPCRFQIWEGESFATASKLPHSFTPSQNPIRKGSQQIYTGINADYPQEDFITLFPGNYFIKEVWNDPTVGGHPPYLLSSKPVKFTIIQEQTTHIGTNRELVNKPRYIRPEILIHKQDKDTGAAPQGKASLAGAQFKISWWKTDRKQAERTAPDKVWILKSDAKGQVKLDKDHLVSGDPLMLDEEGLAYLGFGVMKWQEIKAPEGYVLNEKESDFISLSPASTDGIQCAFTPIAVKDQVVRGDVKFTKMEADTNRPMAHIPFLVTSKTTGERHIIVTDENGSFDSSAATPKHSRNTNRLDYYMNTVGPIPADKLEEGFGAWFAGCADDSTSSKGAACQDGQGAFPYDSYEFQELKTSGNAQFQLVRFQVDITSHQQCVDAKTIYNYAYSLKTQLSYKGEQHDLKPQKDMMLTDAITYDRLEPAATYTLEGELHLTDDTGVDLGILKDAQGVQQVQTLQFKPNASKGRIAMDFQLDARNLAGRKVVCFQTLKKGDQVLVEHRNPKDASQTVNFKKRPPLIQKLPKTGAGTFLWAGIAAGCATAAKALKNLFSALGVHHIW